MTYQYEYLDYIARLSFQDPFGLEATYSCYRRIRALSTHLFSFDDDIWGDGDQFNDYTIQPHMSVRVKGSTENSLLEHRLAHPIQAGQEIEMQSIRRIHHGFKNNDEWWTFKASVPHRLARISVYFPLGREVERLAVTASAGAPAPTVARPGTRELTMVVGSPPVGSLYRADWSW